ncbi:MAG: PAS domain S-box protein [Ignavibacteriaceae bacterium]|jgi:PAS domain S-box-containing protein
MNDRKKTNKELLQELHKLHQENEQLKLTYQKDANEWAIQRSKANDNLQKINEKLTKEIADHKRAEEEQRESKHKYHLLVDSANEAIVVIQDGMLRLSNPMTRTMTGYSEKEIEETPFPLFVHPEDRALVVDNYRKRLQGEYVPGYYIFQLLNKNGGTRWVYMNAVLIDWEGKPATLNFLTDITELKLAREALQQSSRKWEAVISASPDGIGIISLDGKIQHISEKLLILHGYSVDQMDEILGRSIYDFIDPSSHKILIDNTRKLLAGETNHKINEYIALKKDKSRFHIDVNASVLLDSNGNPTSILYVEREITERKLANEAQQQSNQKLEAIISASPDGIGMVSLDGKIQLMSDKLVKMYGYTVEQKDEFFGRSAFDFIDPSYHELLFDNIRKLLAGTKNDGLTEYLAIKKDKSRFFIDMNSAVLLDSDSKPAGLLFVERDITERKRVEKEILQKNLELAELNGTKDKFFSIIAHDLKSPFQGLLGYSKILSEEYETLSEEERLSFINGINELNHSAYKLLENLLEWARIQTGRMTYDPENLNLVEELIPTLSLAKQTALNKGIRLISTIDTSIFVKADKNMLHTIVRNLISNSIKFTNPGGKIILASKIIKDYVETSISDTGVGINKENVDKLFKLEKTISTNGTANEHGTGLGLLLCKEMIERHGGKIRVESEQGKGSTFFFTVPISGSVDNSIL